MTLPWNNIKSSDASITSYIEAINDTNALNPNMSVVMCHPDEIICAIFIRTAGTILPDYHAEIYLEHLMCDMLNCKKHLQNASKKRSPLVKCKEKPHGVPHLMC